MERARLLVEREPEPFRALAYSAILNHLLASAANPAPERQTEDRLASMDLAEFLATHKVVTHPDRVVAIAYHAYHTRNGASISTQDLTDGYSRARIKQPQNFPDVIATCVRKGRLVEGERRDGKKSWVITRTGETYVEQHL